MSSSTSSSFYGLSSSSSSTSSPSSSSGGTLSRVESPQIYPVRLPGTRDPVRMHIQGSVTARAIIDDCARNYQLHNPELYQLCVGGTAFDHGGVIAHTDRVVGRRPDDIFELWRSPTRVPICVAGHSTFSSVKTVLLDLAAPLGHMMSAIQRCVGLEEPGQREMVFRRKHKDDVSVAACDLPFVPASKSLRDLHFDKDEEILVIVPLTVLAHQIATGPTQIPVDMEGYLLKVSHATGSAAKNADKKAASKRYFVQRQQFLLYYHKAPNAKKADQPAAIVPLEFYWCKSVAGQAGSGTARDVKGYAKSSTVKSIALTRGSGFSSSDDQAVDYVLCPTQKTDEELFFRKWLDSLARHAIQFSDSAVFGVPLKELCDRESRADGLSLGAGHMIPKFVQQCADYLTSPRCLETEGLFRLEASKSMQEYFQDMVDQGVPVEFKGHSPTRVRPTDPILVSSLLKRFLRSMPDPLIPFETYSKITAALGATSTGDAARSVQRVLQLLKDVPAENQFVLRYVCSLLHRVARVEAKNRMNASSLATCVGPCFIRNVNTADRDGDGAAAEWLLHNSAMISNLTSVLIEHYDQLAVHLLASGELGKARRGTMLPSASLELDDGPPDAEANTAGGGCAEPSPTDTELAVASPQLEGLQQPVPSPAESLAQRMARMGAVNPMAVPPQVQVKRTVPPVQISPKNGAADSSFVVERPTIKPSARLITGKATKPPPPPAAARPAHVKPKPGVPPKVPDASKRPDVEVTDADIELALAARQKVLPKPPVKYFPKRPEQVTAVTGSLKREDIASRISDLRTKQRAAAAAEDFATAIQLRDQVAVLEKELSAQSRDSEESKAVALNGGVENLTAVDSEEIENVEVADAAEVGDDGEDSEHSMDSSASSFAEPVQASEPPNQPRSCKNASRGPSESAAQAGKRDAEPLAALIVDVPSMKVDDDSCLGSKPSSKNDVAGTTDRSAQSQEIIPDQASVNKAERQESRRLQPQMERAEVEREQPEIAALRAQRKVEKDRERREDALRREKIEAELMGAITLLSEQHTNLVREMTSMATRHLEASAKLQDTEKEVAALRVQCDAQSVQLSSLQFEFRAISDLASSLARQLEAETGSSRILREKLVEQISGLQKTVLEIERRDPAALDERFRSHSDQFTDLVKSQTVSLRAEVFLQSEAQAELSKELADVRAKVYSATREDVPSRPAPLPPIVDDD